MRVIGAIDNKSGEYCGFYGKCVGNTVVTDTNTGVILVTGTNTGGYCGQLYQYWALFWSLIPLMGLLWSLILIMGLF